MTDDDRRSSPSTRGGDSGEKEAQSQDEYQNDPVDGCSGNVDAVATFDLDRSPLYRDEEEEPIVDTVPMSVAGSSFDVGSGGLRCCNFCHCCCCGRLGRFVMFGGDEKPSNEALLSVAFVSFMSFTLVQSGAAIFAQSEAMMGDSAAMFVDAMTYAFNLCAEQMKNRSDSESEVDCSRYSEQERIKARRARERAERKRTLYLELIPPFVSVSTLIVVTSFVLTDAIRTLALDAHRSIDKQSDPNVNLMFCFSMLNLMLDFINVFCFAKAKHALGYNTVDDDDGKVHVIAGKAKNRKVTVPKMRRRRKYDRLPECDNDEDADEEEDGMGHCDRLEGMTLREQVELVHHKDELSPCGSLEGNPTHPQLEHNEEVTFELMPQAANGELDLSGDDTRTTMGSSTAITHHSNKHSYDCAGLSRADRDGDRYDDEHDDDDEAANLNMCSAYTHVFADTLRSIAVVVAATVEKLVQSVTPEEADATAAVIVSVIIGLSLVPLFQGLVRTWLELVSMREEEAEQEEEAASSLEGP